MCLLKVYPFQNKLQNLVLKVVAPLPIGFKNKTKTEIEVHQQRISILRHEAIIMQKLNTSHHVVRIYHEFYLGFGLEAKCELILFI